MSSRPEPSSAESHNWINDFRWWLPLMLLAWTLAWWVRDPFISDWDGYDYTAYIVQGVPSALGLGRALFLGYNRVLWLVAHHTFGLAPEHAYSLIKYGVIVQSGAASLGLYALSRELTANRLAALLSSLILTLSPLFVVYSGRGMSEIPGIVLWSWSLWRMLRSLRERKNLQYILAAAVFGLSANLREFALFYLPVVLFAGWFVLRQWRIPAIAVAVASLSTVAGPLFWLLYWPEYYLPALQSWYNLSAQERREHPVTIRNLWFLLGYLFICAPAATLILPAVCDKVIRQFKSPDERQRLRLLLAGFGLLSVLVLLVNHDLSVNPRYLLTGWLGLAPLCGCHLAELVRQHPAWRQVMLPCLSIITVGSLIGMQIFLNQYQLPQTFAARDYAAKIHHLPDNAVLIVGRRTPLVNYYRNIGARSDWQTIPFGAGWPDDQLSEVIDSHLKAGRPVYVDFDEQLWVEGMREHSRERAGLDLIRRNYQLEIVSDSLQRIVNRI